MRYSKAAEELYDLGLQANRTVEYGLVGHTAKMETFILWYLSRNDNRAFPKDLSRSMAASTAHVSTVLRGLERDGYITRETDPSDCRRVIVHLTQRGLEKNRQLKAARIEKIGAMLEVLTPEEVDTYIRLRKKLLSGAMKE